jgi:NCS1 family nucleobase:cation symporter-1
MINVVGFAGASEPPLASVILWHWPDSAGRTVPLAAVRIYDMSFFTGFGVSAIIYYLANVVAPVPGKSSTWAEVDVSAEEGVQEVHHYPDDKETSDVSSDSKV